MVGELQAALRAIAAGRAPASLESERLDFKEPKPALKEAFADLAEAAVCFANGVGGEIIVGVVDRVKGVAAFVGCDLDPAQVKERIHTLTEPPLLVDVGVELVGEVRLLRIHVPAGVEVHSTKRGLASRRLGTSCLPMRPADVARLSEERRGYDWSALPSGRGLADVHPLALRQAQRYLFQAADPARRRLADLREGDLLRALGAVGERGELNRAGELLFCDAPEGVAPDLVVYQHRRLPGGEADAVLRLPGPLVLAVADVMSAVGTRQEVTPVTLANGQQVQIEEYPTLAVRECVVNALMHGDHRLGQPVHVEHSPDALVVTSPGPLVSGVTPANILTTGSRARFPVLARCFRALGLAEELGQGVDRIFREVIRSGRPAPVIDEQYDRVTVRLDGQPPNSRIAKFIAALPEAEQNDTDTLLILCLLCQHKSVSAADVAPVVQRSVDDAQAALKRLSGQKPYLLEPTRGTLGRRYPSYRLLSEVVVQLGSAVRYHARALDEIDLKIIEHLRDYGQVNNRTVQRLFDVDVYQARGILRDLVGRELIVRTSEQRRGTAVHYGPGPKFPRRR